MLYEVKLCMPSGNVYKCKIEASSEREAVGVASNYGIIEVSRNAGKLTVVNVKAVEAFEVEPVED